MHIIKGYFNSVKEKTNKKQIFKQNFDHNVKNIFYFFFIFSYKCILHIETAFGKFCIVLSRLKRKKYALIYLIIIYLMIVTHFRTFCSLAFFQLYIQLSVALQLLDIQLSVALQLLDIWLSVVLQHQISSFLQLYSFLDIQLSVNLEILDIQLSVALLQLLDIQLSVALQL